MAERDRMLVAERIDFFCERKLNNDFELHFVTYIRIPFDHCHVTFPYKEILSFFGLCHVTFPYMEPLSFLGRFVQKLILSCFSDSFVRKTTQQKGASADGSCNVTSDSQLLYKLYKTASSFLQTPMKNSLWVKNTASPITTTRRVFYPLVNIILYYLETLKNY